MSVNFDQERCQKIAQDLLGYKYKFGSRGQDKEIDCYGLLVLFYKEFGVSIPDYAYVEDWADNEEHYLKEYSTLFRKLEESEEPQPGDMVLFKNIDGAANHSGIYIGNKEFIHSYEKIGTKITKLREKPWKKHFYGFFRVNDKK